MKDGKREGEGSKDGPMETEAPVVSDRGRERGRQGQTEGRLGG